MIGIQISQCLNLTLFSFSKEIFQLAPIESPSLRVGGAVTAEDFLELDIHGGSGPILVFLEGGSCSSLPPFWVKSLELFAEFCYFAPNVQVSILVQYDLQYFIRPRRCLGDAKNPIRELDGSAITPTKVGTPSHDKTFIVWCVNSCWMRL